MSSDLLGRVQGEIDDRLRQLRPAVAEYERLLGIAESLGANSDGSRAPSSRPRRSGSARKRQRAPQGAAQQAIVAALEHGSHTVAELVVVTALSGASIREHLRRLQRAGTVRRAKRDGKAAYALSSRGR